MYESLAKRFDDLYARILNISRREMCIHLYLAVNFRAIRAAPQIDDGLPI